MEVRLLIGATLGLLIACERGPGPVTSPSATITVTQSASNQRMTDVAAKKALDTEQLPEQIVRRFAAELNGQMTAPVTSTSTTPITTPPLYGGIFEDQRFLHQSVSTIRDSQSGIEIWLGELVPQGEFSEAVLVSGNGRICSGTLVSARAMLTAAHCVFDGVTRLVRTFEDEVATGQANVVRSVCFAACDKWEEQGDIAISFLDRDLVVSPPPKASSQQIDAASKIVAVGFGRTEDIAAPAGGAGKKRVVDIIMTSPRCNGTISGRSDAEYYRCRPNVELVAGTPIDNRDTCLGDSGGGIYVRQGNSKLLAGVTSRQLRTSNSARPCGDGGIYVRIDGEVQTWLTQQGISLP